MKLKFPSWMRRSSLALPEWARVIDSTNSLSGKISICIEGDTDGYIKEWFGLLGVTKPDQYWLEVAYQCAKLDLQSALVNTEYDPRGGKFAEFKFTRAPQWALKNFSAGKGTKAATQGREAREHYKRVRGRLPF